MQLNIPKWTDHLLLAGVIDNMSYECINSCLSNFGGFICGGSARMLARYFLHKNEILLKPDNSSLKKRMSLYTMPGAPEQTSFLDTVKNYMISAPPHHKDSGDINKNIFGIKRKMCGDIDIFFEKEKYANDAVEYVKHLIKRYYAQNKAAYTQYLGMSTCGWAHNIQTEKNKIQLIVKGCNNPESLFEKFDIINATCYMKHDVLNFTDEWFQLEESNELGLNDVLSPGIPYRVYKWMGKHHYTKISTKSEDIYIRNCFELISKNPDSIDGIRRSLLLSGLRNFDAYNILLASSLWSGYAQLNLIKNI